MKVFVKQPLASPWSGNLIQLAYIQTLELTILNLSGFCFYHGLCLKGQPGADHGSLISLQLSWQSATVLTVYDFLKNPWFVPLCSLLLEEWPRYLVPTSLKT